jgi:propanol-preferring alcohol dehydrogenase
MVVGLPPEALDLAARGLVKTDFETVPMECINPTFQKMRAGQINGRVVLKMI